MMVLMVWPNRLNYLPATLNREKLMLIFRLKSLPVFFMSALIISLIGCSTNKNPVVGEGYHSARAQANLEIPPDLINTTTDELKQAGQSASGNTVLPTIQGVAIKGAGMQRYLSVGASADDAWRKLHDFVINRGLPILTESNSQGTLETDWIGDVSLDSPTRSRMRKLFGGLVGRYPVNDKYKFWLERLGDDTTAIHVEHTKLTEVLLEPEKRADSLVKSWRESTGNEFKMVEMLRGMQTFFGGTNDASPIVMVRLMTDVDARILLAQPFEQAWVSVGNALASSDYRVLETDSEKNRYLIKRAKQAGFIGKMTFKRKLGVKIEAVENAASSITVTTARGKELDREDALQVLYVLTSELRKQ